MQFPCRGVFYVFGMFLSKFGRRGGGELQLWAGLRLFNVHLNCGDVCHVLIATVRNENLLLALLAETIR